MAVSLGQMQRRHLKYVQTWLNEQFLLNCEVYYIFEKNHVVHVQCVVQYRKTQRKQSFYNLRRNFLKK
jgi:hypothetical protein